jgi:phospholipase C
MRRETKFRLKSACVAAAVALALAPTLSLADDQGNDNSRSATASPIKHVIIIVGENRSFDHIFATYAPRNGRKVSNLLSQGILRADGSPGPNFARAHQFEIVAPPNAGKYFISAGVPAKQLYAKLPPPDVGGVPAVSPYVLIPTIPGGDPGLPPADQFLFTTGGTGLPFTLGPDTRITNVTNLPPGPFQMTGPTMPFDAFTADTIHQYFQMYQQMDCAIDPEHVTRDNPTGCLHDLQSAITTTYSTPPSGTPHDTGQTMAVFNMQQGDAPYFKFLADTYSMSDNYHQPVMGGTGPDSLPLGFADQVFYSDGAGHAIAPPATRIYNPDPQAGTLNLYTHRAQWFNCSDHGAPGIGVIADYLAALPYQVDSRCGPGEYYQAVNVTPAFSPLGGVNTGNIVPQTLQRSIGDVLTANGVSWKYYGGGFNAAGTASPFNGSYCDICNPFEYQAGYPSMVAGHMRDVTDLFADLQSGDLPAVSYVKPDGTMDGHPASSKWSLFEAFAKNIVDLAQANPELWKSTAILITVDEGGGYYDSGFIQPVDFFGTGPRIPMIAVSPFSGGGKVSHVYAEHSSFVKFVERNWKLGTTLSPRSRDNLPNPKQDNGDNANAYVPRNMPAIGDLFDLFTFDDENN